MRFGLLILGVTVAILACSMCIRTPPARMDPAAMSADPAAFLGDDRDRRAARLVDASRGTDLVSLISRPGTERQVVEILRATRAKADGREGLHGTIPADAPGVLFIRRARAVYAAAAEAMASDDVDVRAWGFDAFEVVESCRGGGPSSADPGPPCEGPERDAAITAVARALTSDPDPTSRKRATRLIYRLLPDHDEPSVEAIAAALAREKKDDEARLWLLWLLAARKAPASVILSAAMHGHVDPVTVSVGIHDLLVEGNRGLIEKAYAEGDAIGRAGIGETFYRHQSPMPWAEALILRGLSDPEPEVRARFAKGTLVLRPLNATVRSRLEAMADDVPNAAWALSIEDENRPGGR